jgi:F-type H+-transporting ATPase subunit a
MRRVGIAFLSLACAPAFANSSEGAGPLNVYQLITDSLHLDHKYTAVLSSLLTLVLCTLIGLAFKARVSSLNGKELAPQPRVSLQLFVEMIGDFLYSLAKEHCGHNYRKFLPLLGGIFVFILVCNLSGLIPGFPPATENFSINLAMGLIVFLSYNIAGIREHGVHYIKQFTGPFLVLAPLFLGIELISHSVRPLSLAFRLLANIFCDHLLLGVFSNLAPLVIPALFLAFGLLVAVIQSFVFALLTGIYINMAISHDH